MRMKPKPIDWVTSRVIGPVFAGGKSDASFWQTTSSPDTRLNTSRTYQKNASNLLCYLDQWKIRSMGEEMEWKCESVENGIISS